MPTTASEPFSSPGFPASFRFERKQVYSSPPSGPLLMLAALCDDPPIARYRHVYPRATPPRQVGQFDELKVCIRRSVHWTPSRFDPPEASDNGARRAI